MFTSTYVPQYLFLKFHNKRPRDKEAVISFMFIMSSDRLSICPFVQGFHHVSLVSFDLMITEIVS